MRRVGSLNNNFPFVSHFPDINIKSYHDPFCIFAMKLVLAVVKFVLLSAVIHIVISTVSEERDYHIGQEKRQVLVPNDEGSTDAAATASRAPAYMITSVAAAAANNVSNGENVADRISLLKNTIGQLSSEIEQLSQQIHELSMKNSDVSTDSVGFAAISSKLDSREDSSKQMLVSTPGATLTSTVESVRITYERMLKCVKNSKSVSPKSSSFGNWKYPADAEKHYKELLAKTDKFRHTPVHTHGYKDLWIGARYIFKKSFTVSYLTV